MRAGKTHRSRFLVSLDAVIGDAALKLVLDFQRIDVAAQAGRVEPEARVNIERFQQLLFERVIFAERGSCEVDEGFGVVDGFEKLREFARDGAAETLFSVQEFCEIQTQAAVFLGVGTGRTRESFDAHAAVGLIMQNLDDLDARETLEQQIGRTVGAFLAGTHDADSGDAVGRFELSGVFGAFRVEAGHGEKPVGRERILQHLLITRLKNVQWHECLREKGDVLQRHDRDLVGQGDLHFHAGHIKIKQTEFNRCVGRGDVLGIIVTGANKTVL